MACLQEGLLPDSFKTLFCASMVQKGDRRSAGWPTHAPPRSVALLPLPPLLLAWSSPVRTAAAQQSHPCLHPRAPPQAPALTASPAWLHTRLERSGALPAPCRHSCEEHIGRGASHWPTGSIAAGDGSAKRALSLPGRSSCRGRSPCLDWPTPLVALPSLSSSAGTYPRL